MTNKEIEKRCFDCEYCYLINDEGFKTLECFLAAILKVMVDGTEDDE